MSALVNTLRWFARISGLLIAGMYTLMVIGEFTHPHSSAPSTVQEWTGIVLLTATCAGMLIGWRWELPGAILSLVALVCVHLNNSHEIPHHPVRVRNAGDTLPDGLAG
jgi:hypothetical protein